MRLYAPFALLILSLLTGCGPGERDADPANWTEDELNAWFEEKAWLGSTELTADPSINKRELAVRYHEHPERWDKAFAYLRRPDLSSVEPGRHEIAGKDVIAVVSEYKSKEPGEVQYESHRQYTDVQYVVSGTEHIGRKDLSGSEVVTPYNEERDVAFYNPEGGVNLRANPGNVFIFFPDDVHRPGVKAEESVAVKKVVVKVKN